jgi:hypothetical protein
MIHFFKKVAVSASAIVALTTAGVMATAGPAQADPADRTWGFRLSNFGPFIATVCVITDRQTQCTGRIPIGTSRVYDVRFHNPRSFHCSAKSDWRGSVQSRKFSRREFKECLWTDAGGLFAKRPNGTQVHIGTG